MKTGAENHDVSRAFTVGERVKIRLVNEMDSDHPMHHPFHIHEAGRFLIRSSDEKSETDLVWRDTLLLRAGETVDILLYVTNLGLWIAYCYITEQIESARCQELDTLIHYSRFGHLNLRMHTSCF